MSLSTSQKETIGVFIYTPETLKVYARDMFLKKLRPHCCKA